MNIMITGHRPNKLNHEWNHNGPLSKILIQRIKDILTQHGATTFISGMALGADQLGVIAAIDSVDIKKIFAAIPCKNHCCKWPATSQSFYNKLLSNPKVETVLVSDKEYNPQLMQIRNEWMADRCDKAIAVWDKSNGGTANCIRYLKKIKKEIIFINPQELL